MDMYLSDMKELMFALKLLGCPVEHFIGSSDANQTELSDIRGISRSSLNRKLNGGVSDYEELNKPMRLMFYYPKLSLKLKKL